MGIGNAMICILITTLAASYGWGMRGSLIGGEKGAMLPGALIGLVFGCFYGYGFASAAAAGLMGMTFGGTETYGETIGLVLHRGRDDYNPVKGYAGLAFKGALWFAVCGAFLGISLSYGIYEHSEIYLFCLLIPVMQIVGQLIFNRPYNPEKNKFPKIYFSKKRREEWGGNLFMLAALVIMALIKEDYFTVLLIAGGFIFGAIGWLVAMRAYVAAVFPLKNGKYLFGRFYHKGVIDGWKLMEFILGAFGGFGLSLAYCFGYGYVEIYRDRASLDGVEFADEYLSDWIPIICGACVLGIVAVNLVSFMCDRKGKKLNSYILDHIERPFYNVIPMMFVLAGNYFSARFMTAFMLVFVVVNKLIFDRFKKVNLISVLLGASVCAVSFILFVGNRIKPVTVVLAGTLPYLAGEIIWVLSKQGRHGKSLKDSVTKTPFATVFPSFVVMSALLIISFCKFF
ncbi:MAG: hypothetical protein IJE72_03745 [Clostridia bacterium]|nr:hypothetical protein [Clostridia bacterium]